MLLLSTKVLDAMAFNTGGTNEWASSSLRKWMNDTFYYNAFGYSERKAIVQVSHKAGPQDTSNDRDYVFVLSMEEIKTYLPYAGDRMFGATTYAIGRGVYRGKNGLACWWTRTYFSKGIAYNIWSDGDMTHGDNVTSKDGGVLPAVWVDIDVYMGLQ